MPAGRANAIMLRADETISATINSRQGERLDGIVPILPLTTDARELRWSWLEQGGHYIYPKLRALTDRQKLVGYGGIMEGDAVKAASDMFTGCEMIPMKLNAAQPLPGTAACWETLDVITLDAALMQRVDEQQLSALVAAGVAFAVRADKPPFSHWPWKKAGGGWWTLHYTPAGPAAATYNSDVYAPVTGINGGWPAAKRKRFALEGTGFVLVMLLLALWRPRYTVILGALITAGTSAVLLYWHQWERPLRIVEGKIRVISPDITQDDDWAYYVAADRTFSRCRWVDTMKLVLPGPEMLVQMDPRVECFSNGDIDALAFGVLARTRRGPALPPLRPAATGDTAGADHRYTASATGEGDVSQAGKGDRR